jgi:hypothetical protein
LVVVAGGAACDIINRGIHGRACNSRD